MKPEVTHRPYEPSDRDACLAIFDSNVAEYFTPNERTEFEAFIDELPGPYLVLERAGHIIGCGGYAYREEGRIADLCWGMIHRDLHRTGLGRYLATGRLEYALEDPRVEVVALNTTQLTSGFYEKMGFSVISVEKDGYSPGLDRCEMRYEVPPR